MRIFNTNTCCTLVLCLFVAACAGRDPNPVEVVKATDTMLNCPLIVAELTGNTSRARTLLKQQEDTDSDNAALVATGIILFWPALFFMDLSAADKIEMAALQNRNQYLAALGNDKGCEVDLPTTVKEADERDLKRRIEEAESSGAAPNCADVGGYEAYKERTGRVCDLSGGSVQTVSATATDIGKGNTTAAAVGSNSPGPTGSAPDPSPPKNPVRAYKTAPAMYQGGDLSYTFDFVPGGALDGHMIDTGFHTEEADSGTWKVKNGLLCATWARWDGGRQNCYTIQGGGPEVISSGASGVLSGRLRFEKGSDADTQGQPVVERLTALASPHAPSGNAMPMQQVAKGSAPQAVRPVAQGPRPPQEAARPPQHSVPAKHEAPQKPVQKLEKKSASPSPSQKPIVQRPPSPQQAARPPKQSTSGMRRAPQNPVRAYKTAPAMYQGGDLSYSFDFVPGGALDGHMIDTGFHTEEADSGTWKVKNGLLCATWARWDGGRQNCYTIQGGGPEVISSGASGVLSGRLRFEKGSDADTQGQSVIVRLTALASPHAPSGNGSSYKPNVGRPPVGSSAADAGRRGLAGVFSGARVTMERAEPGPCPATHIWLFDWDGTVSGTAATEGHGGHGDMASGGCEVDESDTGRWLVEANRLCTTWTRWDRGQRNCYTVSIGDRQYVASDSRGVLAGPFVLEK